MHLKTKIMSNIVTSVLHGRGNLGTMNIAYFMQSVEEIANTIIYKGEDFEGELEKYAKELQILQDMKKESEGVFEKNN